MGHGLYSFMKKWYRLRKVLPEIRITLCLCCILVDLESQYQMNGQPNKHRTQELAVNTHGLYNASHAHSEQGTVNVRISTRSCPREPDLAMLYIIRPISKRSCIVQTVIMRR